MFRHHPWSRRWDKNSKRFVIKEKHASEKLRNHLRFRLCQELSFWLCSCIDSRIFHFSCFSFFHMDVSILSLGQEELGTPWVKPPTFYHFNRTYTQLFKHKIGLTRGVPSFGWVDVGCVKILYGGMIPRFRLYGFCIGTGYTGRKFQIHFGKPSWMRMLEV